MTQPTTTTWGAVGCPRLVPYEAPQGRRLKAIGGYFSHGPLSGELRFATFASVPKPEKLPDGSFRKPLSQQGGSVFRQPNASGPNRRQIGGRRRHDSPSAFGARCALTSARTDN